MTDLATRTPTAFDLALITDAATGVYDLAQLAEKHGLPVNVLESAMDNPLFKQQVEAVKADIAKNGFLTKTRATSIINEDLIPRIQEQIYNLDTTPDEMAKLGQLLVKLAGLDVKEPVDQGKNVPQMPTITINIPAPAAQPVIINKAAEPITIEAQ